MPYLWIGKRSLVRIALPLAMHESRGMSRTLLDPLEARVLRLIKPRSLREKQIAKAVGVDPILLDPVITGLILKGYLEILRKRRLYLFSRELCAITPDGIAELERYGNPIQNFLNLLRERAETAFEDLLSGSRPLRITFGMARAVFRVTGAIL